MCLMKDTKGNLFLDSKTIKEYRQRGVVSRKIILCYILAFLRWTSIGLPPGQKCSRWVRRHNGISLSPARLLKKYTGDAASIPLKKKHIAGLLIESCGQLGKISQPIHVQWIRRPDYNEKTLRYRKSIGLPPGQKCSRWVRRHNGISFSPARLLKKVYWRRRQYPFYIKKRVAGLLIESCGQLGKYPNQSTCSGSDDQIITKKS